MKRLRLLLPDLWRPALMYLAAGVIISSLFLFRLPTLVPGFSQPELVARYEASEGRRILDNPIDLPHKLGQYVWLKAGSRGALAMRSISALVAAVVVVFFYRVLRTFYSTRLAILGTLMFATSSWLLHIARLGTPEILQISSVLLIWCGLLLRVRSERSYTLFLMVLTIAALCYIPGLLWFILPCLIWQRKAIVNELSGVPWWTSFAAVLLGMIILVPLIVSVIYQPVLIRQLLGLPAVFDIKTIGFNLLDIPKQLFFQGPDNPVIWLGRTPLLDIFSGVMFILGLYWIIMQHRLDRARLVIALLVSCSLLTALGGSVTMALLLPIVYLVIAAGIALMLQQWFTVFPRNPFARKVGAVLLTVAVATACWYNLTHYFIAWPNTTETRVTFTAKP